MTISGGFMIGIWDRRIRSLEEKISDLKRIGIPANDKELQELYKRLEFFRRCRTELHKDLIISSDNY